MHLHALKSPCLANMIRKLKFIWQIALVTLILSSCTREEPTTVLRLAHSLDTEHPVHKAMEHMNQRLQVLSKNTMRIQIYPNGQLGNEREMIELLQIGSLAMTKVSASPLESFVPVMQVFNIPYIFRDSRHYRAVLDSDIGRSLLQAPTIARLRGLGFYDAGARSFYTVSHPIMTASDLAGLKIRVQESATALQMVTALGGAPTPIAWGELYTALQQGVVDGAENNPVSFYLSGHYEICQYFTLDEHTAVPDLLLIGTFAWDALSEQQQDWLQQAATDSVIYQRRLWQLESDAALESIKAAGVQIIRPDVKEFQGLASAMHSAYANTEVGNMIEHIKAFPDGG